MSKIRPFDVFINADAFVQCIWVTSPTPEFKGFPAGFPGLTLIHKITFEPIKIGHFDMFLCQPLGLWYLSRHFIHKFTLDSKQMTIRLQIEPSGQNAPVFWGLFLYPNFNFAKNADYRAYNNNHASDNHHCVGIKWRMIYRDKAISLYVTW